MNFFFSSNQVFSTFFSKFIAFAKFLLNKCEREFLHFPHCAHNFHTVHTAQKIFREINYYFYIIYFINDFDEISIATSDFPSN